MADSDHGELRVCLRSVVGIHLATRVVGYIHFVADCTAIAATAIVAGLLGEWHFGLCRVVKADFTEAWVNERRPSLCTVLYL